MSQTTTTPTGPELTPPPGSRGTSAPECVSRQSEQSTRLVLGLVVVCGLAGVSLLSRPQASVAGVDPTGPGSAARLTSGGSTHRPQFELSSPSTTFLDAAGLGGHSGIPMPPVTDDAGRASLGVLVGPALFVWVYGGDDGVRYSVVDVRGQVLAAGLTAAEVYGSFPEINIPEMQFGPDGQMCEPVMWAGDDIE